MTGLPEVDIEAGLPMLPTRAFVVSVEKYI